MLKVTLRPDRFLTAVTIEVACEKLLPVIVRILNPVGKIVQAFSWQLSRGMNTVMIDELDTAQHGIYHVDFLNSDATLLYREKLEKKEKATPVIQSL